MQNPKNYWDYIVKDGNTYQMGAQSHRIFLLNLLLTKEVDTILDVGCGTAPIYQLIKTEFLFQLLKYKGVDYSEGMIEVCKKEFPAGNFEVQDARNLKEEDNSWDCVLLLHALDHVDDYKLAISEAARVAKKYVLIVLWRAMTTNGQNNLNSKNSLDRQDGKDWEDTHLQEYAKEKLMEAFKENNLELEFEKNDEEINKEGKTNTLFLLKKI